VNNHHGDFVLSMNGWGLFRRRDGASGGAEGGRAPP
jgi:hypothetical protein